MERLSNVFNIHFAGIVNGFPSTILVLLLGELTAYRKGTDTSGRTTPKDERISCGIESRYF